MRILLLMLFSLSVSAQTVGIGPSGDLNNPYAVAPLVAPPPTTLHPTFESALREACIQEGFIDARNVVTLTNPITDTTLNVDCTTGIITADQPVTVQ